MLDISRIINSFTSCLIFLVKHHSRKGGTIALVFFLHLPNYTIPRATLLKDGFHQPNGHIPIDSPSIRRRNFTWKVRRNYIDFERKSTWKLWHRFDVEIPTWIRLLKSTKYRCVLNVDFSTLFRYRIDVTSVLAVSIVSFPNIFCSGNLF